MYLVRKMYDFFLSFITCILLMRSISACGFPSFQPLISGKIINGEEAKANSWPWMVSLREKSGQFYSKHICGAVIIDKNTVLTASHCTLFVQIPSQLAIFVGLHSSRTIPPSNDIYSASKIFIHPEYNKTSLRNDISVIKLVRPIVFSDKVSNVCLPPSANIHDTLYDKDVVATGWGVAQDGNLPTYLQQASLKILNDSFFDVIRQNVKIFVPTEQYAVVEDRDKSDTNICFGDSGGPLVFYNGNKWILGGIASYVLTYKNGSCAPSVPSFFTSVPYYLDFITSFSNYSIKNSSNFFKFQFEYFLMGVFIAILNTSFIFQ